MNAIKRGADIYKIVILSDKYLLPLPVSSCTVLKKPTHPTAHKRGGEAVGMDKQ
jgi:hypothetical protein